MKKKVFQEKLDSVYLTKQNYWFDFDFNFIIVNWVYHCSYKLKIFLWNQDPTYWLIVDFLSIEIERKDDRWQVYQGD